MTKLAIVLCVAYGIFVSGISFLLGITLGLDAQLVWLVVAVLGPITLSMYLGDRL